MARKGMVAVTVRRGGHKVTFHKHGSKESLCRIQKITIKGRTFMGRRGGRTHCGPSTGKNSPSARAARAQFKRMVKGMKRRHTHRRAGARRRARR